MPYPMAMDDAPGDIGWTLESRDGLHAIAPEDWDRCAGGANPLQSHAFLAAMEDSGSATAETGWTPRHLVLSDASGHIHGVMPFYAKWHSYGEYVFDHAWANAWQQAGGEDYPTGLSAIPFSPVPGNRLMVDSPEPKAALAALAAGAVEAGSKMELSSLHLNFLSEAEADFLAGRQAGWIRRKGVQYHWRNRDAGGARYDGFDGFLDALASRKRKTIRRERRDVAAAGVSFHRLTGSDLNGRHWDDFYRFYLATLEGKWGGAYLTRSFFDRIGATMADRILLVMAEKDGDMVAGALNFIGEDTLYGRNWGCAADIPFLHFETCYYQAIEFAVERGLTRVEAGAQGMHKVQRGYEPVATWSAHYLYHDGFAAAIRDFTTREAQAIDRECEELRSVMPYRRGGPDSA